MEINSDLVCVIRSVGYFKILRLQELRSTGVDVHLSRHSLTESRDYGPTEHKFWKWIEDAGILLGRKVGSWIK